MKIVEQRNQVRTTINDQIRTQQGAQSITRVQVANINDKLSVTATDSVLTVSVDLTINPTNAYIYVGKTVKLESGVTLTVVTELEDLTFDLFAIGSNATFVSPGNVSRTIEVSKLYKVVTDGNDNYFIHPYSGNAAPGGSVSTSLDVTGNITINASTQDAYHDNILLFKNDNPITITIQSGVRFDFRAVGIKLDDNITVSTGAGVTLLDNSNQLTEKRGAIISIGNDTYDMPGFTGVTPPSASPEISAPSVQPGSTLTAIGNYQASADSGPEGTSLIQWQVDTGAGFADIAGATNTTYQAPANSDGFDYRVRYRPVSQSGVQGDFVTSASITISSAAPQKMRIKVSLGSGIADGNVNNFPFSDDGQGVASLIDFNTAQGTGVSLTVGNGNKVQLADDSGGELVTGFGGFDTDAILGYRFTSSLAVGEFRDMILSNLPGGTYRISLVIHRNSSSGNRLGTYRVQGVARNVDARQNTDLEIWNNVADNSGEILIEDGPQLLGHFTYINALDIEQL